MILTRAAKLSGAPTVASRFMQRLQAVAGEERWKAALSRGDRYLHWARALDQPEMPPKSAPRPLPKPVVELRPQSLSVTEIELLLRDPYSIYARTSLRLQPLDAVDTPPGARDRGTVIHEAIGTFTERYKNALPADPLEELLRLGREGFAKLADFPTRALSGGRAFSAWRAGSSSSRENSRANSPGFTSEVPRGATKSRSGDESTFKLRTRATASRN